LFAKVKGYVIPLCFIKARGCVEVEFHPLSASEVDAGCIHSSCALCSETGVQLSTEPISKNCGFKKFYPSGVYENYVPKQEVNLFPEPISTNCGLKKILPLRRLRKLCYETGS
jgi:hypothetical protein